MEKLTAPEVAQLIMKDYELYKYNPKTFAASMWTEGYEWPTRYEIQCELLNNYRVKMLIRFVGDEIRYTLLSC